MTSNQSQHNQYWYVSLFNSTTLIWQDIHCLKFQCHHLMMTLLHDFCHQTCSIYWMVMICLGIVPDNQYQRFFSIHSLVILDFSHSCMVTIFQGKNSKTKNNNVNKYIEPSTLLIIMNISNCFSNLVFVGILMNSADNIVDWRTLHICKSLCIFTKYPEILVLFPLKRPMFLLWNSWYFGSTME